MKKARKHKFLTASKARLIEWIGVALVCVLFIVLAVLNRDSFCAPENGTDNRILSSNTYYGYTVKQLQADVENAGFVLQSDAISSPSGSEWAYEATVDADGISDLSINVPLRPVSKGKSSTDALHNQQNEQIRSELLSLLEAIWPSMGGSIADAEKLVQGCESALSSQKTKSFSTKRYACQAIPSDEGVILRFIRENIK